MQLAIKLLHSLELTCRHSLRFVVRRIAAPRASSELDRQLTRYEGGQPTRDGLLEANTLMYPLPYVSYKQLVSVECEYRSDGQA